MKLICLFLIVFLSLHSTAQKTTESKILIGYNFSSDYNFRILKNSDGIASSEVVIKSRNDIEVAKFGYTTGLNVSFNVSQCLAFETGIQFSNNGYQTKNQELSYQIPDDQAPSKAKFIYSYQYLGIPLKAKFSFGKSKVRFISGVGFITNFLVNEKQKIKYEYLSGREETKVESINSDLNNINIVPVISVGIDYTICSKIHLIAEPTFRYSLLKLKSAPITENLWNAGLNIGVYCGLK